MKELTVSSRRESLSSFGILYWCCTIRTSSRKRECFDNSLMALILAASVILGIVITQIVEPFPCKVQRRSQVVMDPADNRFIHSLAFPFNVKGNAMSITWSLDTPVDWKRSDNP
ncbi:hypothetical protein Tco_0061082, partial [Tanacetum coccineum]